MRCSSLLCRRFSMCSQYELDAIVTGVTFVAQRVASYSTSIERRCVSHVYVHLRSETSRTGSSESTSLMYPFAISTVPIAEHRLWLRQFRAFVGVVIVLVHIDPSATPRSVSVARMEYRNGLRSIRGTATDEQLLHLVP